MHTTFILWGIAAALALLMLFRMMRQRQAHLTRLLHDHVQAQLRWSRKRGLAAKLARDTARRLEARETEAPPATGTNEAEESVQEMSVS